MDIRHGTDHSYQVLVILRPTLDDRIAICLILICNSLHNTSQMFHRSFLCLFRTLKTLLSRSALPGYNHRSAVRQLTFLQYFLSIVFNTFFTLHCQHEKRKDSLPAVISPDQLCPEEIIVCGRGRQLIQA